MSGLLLDLRTAVRQLRKTPGFTVAAVLMLALGIGATVAIFSVVNGILLRPLPFPHADRLVSISDEVHGAPGSDGSDSVFGSTAQDIVDEVRDSHSFSSLGGWKYAGFTLSGGDGAVQNITAARLTSGVFPALRVAPLLGRTFTAQEDANHIPVTVISYGLWHERFQSSPLILGHVILLDRKPYTVIGVMPRSFEFPFASGLASYRLWVPMSFSQADLSAANDSSWQYNVIARLRPGVTEAQALADLSTVDRETMRAYPPYMAGFQISPLLTSLHADTVDGARPLLHLLFIAVAVVLTIACANMASLLLVRALHRRRETAVRLALGARPRTILRQGAFESLLLSLAGAAFGTALAALAIHLGLSLLPDSLPLLHQVTLSPMVLGFAIALALLTGLLCGLAPAFAALNADMNNCLKEGGRTGSNGGSHAMLRSALVVGEIAVALALVSASGLLLRSFEKMGAVRLGYEPAHVLTAGYALPFAEYHTQASIDTFDRAMIARLRRLPSVGGVAISTFLPSSNGGNNSAFVAEGYTPPPSIKLDLANTIDVQGGYFQVLGMHLLRGRPLTPEDTAHTALVAVVNRKLAEQTWPRQNPIGKHIRFGINTTPTPWMTVVGEVEDVKEGAPEQPDTQQYYVPLSQQIADYGSLSQPGNLDGNSGLIALTTTLPPEELEKPLRDTVHSIDPQLALDNIQTMDQALASVEAPRRFNTTLISAFAAAALLLALLGIYSILAFSVALRTQEMAIRLALGSQRSDVVRLILVSGAKLAGIGCILGLALAVAGEKLIASLLFGVSATDPLILAAAALAIFLLTLAVSLLPARRAAAVSPVEALRGQ